MRWLGLLSVVAACLLAWPASAEMGRASVGTGVFVEAQGGLAALRQDGSIGHGVAPDTLAEGVDELLRPERGWLAGAAIGYVLAAPVVGVDRIELSIDTARASDGAEGSPGVGRRVLLSSVDGNLVAAADEYGSSQLERRHVEGRLAFKRDFVDGANSLTLGLVPFLRRSEETADAAVAGAGRIALRNGEVDTLSLGAMLVAEPELQLADGLSLVGHLGLGAYRYTADAAFRSSSPSSTVFDMAFAEEASGDGLRAAAGLGLKLQLSQAMTVTVFGTADYLSAVPAAVTSPNQLSAPVQPAHLRIDDRWELQTGLRLTVGLGPR